MAFCSGDAARFACSQWHYTGSMPAAGVRIGAWEGDRFIGAVCYGLGAGNSTRGERYGLARRGQVAELVHVALCPEHDTPTSRVVAMSIKVLRRQSPGLRMLISFADEARQGHMGTIYQASNWIYAGVSKGVCGYMVHGEFQHMRGFTGKGSKPVPEHAVPVKSLKHRYLYPMDRAMRRQLAEFARPYPKAAASDTLD